MGVWMALIALACLWTSGQGLFQGAWWQPRGCPPQRVKLGLCVLWQFVRHAVLQFALLPAVSGCCCVCLQLDLSWIKVPHVCIGNTEGLLLASSRAWLCLSHGAALQRVPTTGNRIPSNRIHLRMTRVDAHGLAGDGSAALLRQVAALNVR